MLVKAGAAFAEKDEKKISDLLALIFFCLIIVNISPILESITGVPYTVVSSFAKMFLAAGCVLYSPVLLRRLQPAMIVVPVIMVLVMLVHMLFFDESYKFFSDTFESFATLCLPAMMYCFALRDYDQLRKSFIKMSYAISLLTALLFLLGFSTVKAYFAEDSSYAQGLGYAYLIPILFLIQDYINRKKLISLVCSVALSLFILIFASRGPLLGIALFSVVYMYRYLIRRRKILTIVMITIAAAFLVIEFEQILYMFLSALQKLGISSRSVMLFSSNLTYDSGRSYIQQPLLREISAHPFLIRGISSDFLLVGTYAHNIVIELFYEFGVILGGSLVLYFAWRVGRTAFSNVTDIDKSICFIFLCASVTSLLVSGTLWTSQTFWIWYALQRNIFKVSPAEPKGLQRQEAES